MISSNMEKGNYLTSILRSHKSVFTTKDIALLWHEPVTPATWVRLNYYVKKGDLVQIRKGLYAKSQDYNRLELATRIFTPSYVSFETVLAQEGLIFQYYDQIFVASYLTRAIVVDQHTYIYQKMKAQVLIDSTGISHVDETSIATKERAFLDRLSIHPDYYFDNLRSLDWETIAKILPIYNNQRMVNLVNKLYKQTYQRTL